MTISTAAGTNVALVSGLPATYDAAGFGALVFVDVGEVENVPEFGGTSQEITFTSLKDAVVRKAKGAFDAGSVSLVLGRDVSDAGQALLKSGAVHTNNTEHSFEVTFPDGSIQYFSALVMSYTTNTNDVNSIIRSTALVSITNVVIEA